jgi:hypothetical protein
MIDEQVSGWWNPWMHVNPWRETLEWLMSVQAEIGRTKHPTWEVAPRTRRQWDEWYSRACKHLLSGEDEALETAQALAVNPAHTIRLESEAARYLLSQRIAFAYRLCGNLADLCDPTAGPNPLAHAIQDDPVARERMRRWLLLDRWDAQGNLLWEGSLMQSAMACQALENWQEEE